MTEKSNSGICKRYHVANYTSESTEWVQMQDTKFFIICISVTEVMKGGYRWDNQNEQGSVNF